MQTPPIHAAAPRADADAEELEAVAQRRLEPLAERERRHARLHLLERVVRAAGEEAAEQVELGGLVLRCRGCVRIR